MSIKTIKLPFQATKDGRLAVIEGEEAIEQTVKIALMPSDSTNPFQKDLGIGYDVVFRTNDPALLSLVIGRVERIFARLANQDYAMIDNQQQPYFENVGDESICILRVQYINMETDRKQEISVESP